jgi:hypothetical protein
LVGELDIPAEIGLEEFLAREIIGSTLRIRSGSEGKGEEFFLESDTIVRVHVIVNRKTKKIEFDLFSPRWSRKINVEELGGFTFMESHAEDELMKEDAASISEDTLLALDLIRSWAKLNSYEVSETEPDLSQIKK